MNRYLLGRNGWLRELSYGPVEYNSAVLVWRNKVSVEGLKTNEGLKTKSRESVIQLT
jgi:hypothetical protein